MISIEMNSFEVNLIELKSIQMLRSEKIMSHIIELSCSSITVSWLDEMYIKYIVFA